jgi:hypothetical protein
MRFSEFRKHVRNKDLRQTVSWDDLHWYYPKHEEEPNVGERVYRKGQRQPMVVEDRRSVSKDDGYWHVQPIGYFPDGVSVYIACPYCKNVHIHGNGNGHRNPHCDPGVNSNKGYIIDGADGIIKE